MTAETASEWLKSNYPRYKIWKWGGSSSSKSVFYDTKEDRDFEIKFTNLKIHLKEGRSVGKFKETEYTAKRWLKQNAPHIDLLSWSGKASAVSYFHDKRRDLNFEYDFRTLKYELSVNNNYLPRATKKEKVKAQEKTNLQKYGVKCNLSLESNKQKVKQTNLKKYGVEYPGQSEKVRQKIRNKRIENGTSYSIDGKTIGQILQNENNASYTTLLNVYKNLGKEGLLNYKKQQSIIENKIFNFLKENNIKFTYDKKINGRRYDFLIEENKLIIECNGLYWHSDLCERNFSDKFYHQNKLQHYESLGYRVLFLNEDEIRDKFPIVKSIILNSIGKSNRIYARKTEFKAQEIGNKFFDKNHLMGAGAGRVYSLKYDDKIVAAMQVKWKNKKEKILEISRFCPKLNHSVVGGFSKLLKNIIKIEKPKKVISFIDRRYGNGKSLEILKFIKINEDISFRWTNLKESIHRMKFPGNSGYEHGLAKIWDCGQSKYELII